MNIYSHLFQEARVKNCEAITAALDFKKPNSYRGEDGEENNGKVAV